MMDNKSDQTVKLDSDPITLTKREAIAIAKTLETRPFRNAKFIKAMNRYQISKKPKP